MDTNITALTADIVTAYVSGNSIEPGDLPGLIAATYEALSGLGAPKLAEQTYEPTVSVRSSVKPDHIISLIDGKPYKMLKRHLSTAYGMSPEEYREKWGLPADYPMVAPNYAKQRSSLAKKIGLGKRRGGE